MTAWIKYAAKIQIAIEPGFPFERGVLFPGETPELASEPMGA
jgi:hypothetical protein